VYSPMQSGLLTGAFTAERAAALPADDWRRNGPEFTTHLDRNLALSAAPQPIAQRYGVSRGAVAVAWTLAWPGVTGPSVGAHRARGRPLRQLAARPSQHPLVHLRQLAADGGGALGAQHVDGGGEGLGEPVGRLEEHDRPLFRDEPGQPAPALAVATWGEPLEA